MSIEMKIKGLMLDPVTNNPIIVLKDERGDAVLPIWVGIFEANAIAMQLENITAPRPMTHDLLKNVIDSLDCTLERITITDLRDNTFFAMIHLVRDGGETLTVDSRPSDAMALALRADAPIFVEPVVLEKSSATGEDGEPQQTERLRRWLETVDPDDLGRYEM